MTGWLMRRWIALLIVLVLAGLFFWQRHRLDLIEKCIRAGGAWNGAASKCGLAPGPPILQRDLRRT